MKKLFASDFDGTLSLNCKVSERSVAAISAFRAAGGLFGVVTGRSVAGSEFLFDQVESGLDFILACNGSVFIRPDKTCVAFAGYPGAMMRDMWSFALEGASLGLGPQAADESLWITTDDPEGEAKIEGFVARHETVLQCNMVFHSSQDAARTAALLNERFGDVINALQNGGSVDIPAAGVDKAFGVRRLAELFGVDEKNVYSAGDQMNDFAMVDAFYGFAMEGAPEALSAAAKKTVSDVGEALEMIMRGEV